MTDSDSYSRDAKVLLSYPLYKQYRDQNGILCDMDHVANIPTLDWKVALQDNLKDHRVRNSYSPCLSSAPSLLLLIANLEFE